VSAAGAQWSRTRKSLLAILFFLYGASVLLWFVEVAGGLYLPPRWSWGLLGFLGIFVFGFSIVVWALLSPRSWARWRIVGLALLLGALALWADLGVLTRLSDERFLQRPDLNAFAARLHAYGRISEMREWQSEGLPTR
jgi:hypothetical protein